MAKLSSTLSKICRKPKCTLSSTSLSHKSLSVQSQIWISIIPETRQKKLWDCNPPWNRFNGSELPCAPRMRYLNWISEAACRGVHTTFISVHWGKEGRWDTKRWKRRTKRSMQCFQPPSCWINTSVRAQGQATASDHAALQVWVSFICLCNSGFKQHEEQRIQKVFMECHPLPSCWKSCELDTGGQHWQSAAGKGCGSCCPGTAPGIPSSSSRAQPSRTPLGLEFRQFLHEGWC